MVTKPYWGTGSGLDLSDLYPGVPSSCPGCGYADQRMTWHSALNSYACINCSERYTRWLNEWVLNPCASEEIREFHKPACIKIIEKKGASDV